MRNYLAKLSTCRWKTGSLIFCIIGSAFLAVVGYTPIYRTPPIVMLVLCAVALLIEWKTLYLGTDKLQVCYNLALVKRTIDLNRIHSLEIILKNDDCSLLISLDNCPSYKESTTSSVDFFVLKHPIKVIAIQCRKEDAMNFKSCFDVNNIPTDVIIKGRKPQHL